MKINIQALANYLRQYKPTTTGNILRTISQKVLQLFRTGENNPKSKHICNSHKPTHRPKIAKELTLPTQTKLF
ncbi:MAG: hypothetical protein U0T74_13540 [Chitinophagales bacterium]